MENQDSPASALERNRRLQTYMSAFSFGSDRSSEGGSQAPTSGIRPSHTPLTPHQSFLQRHRLHRSRPTAGDRSESPNTVQETVDRLSETHPILPPFLEDPTSHVVTPNILTSEYHAEGEHNRKKPKRRKMNQEPVEEQNTYGYRGRVVSGPLKMDLMICDGGYMTEPGRSKTLSYPPQNILRNDKSVYCTQTSECNLVFRHVGNQPFSLKKVVIKAPKSGFDAPIQEGMIFVSMTSDHLLTRTSQYRLREKTPPALPTARTSPEIQVEVEPASSTADNPTQLGMFGQFLRSQADDRPPSRRTGLPAGILPYGHLTNHSSASYPRPFFQGVLPSPLIDLSSPPRNRTTGLPLPVRPMYSSIASHEDFSADEEEESSPTVLADLADRCRRDYPFTSSSEDEDEEPPSQATRRRIRRLRASPRKMVWEDLGDPEGVGPVDLMPKVEMLAPHAKFFIESKQSMVSVKFDPPVCGKFILFKLWSPAEGQNIDIQSILCYGFGGPRYFPAIETM
ncbi:hypothetical protein MMC30_004427 [Trapelia coarctata]|nr:hypothetical protein [Trapelia coarctata]